jgi:hypothetical protein
VSTQPISVRQLRFSQPRGLRQAAREEPQQSHFPRTSFSPFPSLSPSTTTWGVCAETRAGRPAVRTIKVTRAYDEFSLYEDSAPLTPSGRVGSMLYRLQCRYVRLGSLQYKSLGDELHFGNSRFRLGYLVLLCDNGFKSFSPMDSGPGVGRPRKLSYGVPQRPSTYLRTPPAHHVALDSSSLECDKYKSLYKAVPLCFATS